MKTKKLLILLTCFPDCGSRLLRLLTGAEFTHASIGLEEDRDTFYSFICKGFAVEKMTRYARMHVKHQPCRLYELDVPCSVYEQVRRLLQLFRDNRQTLRYSHLGVAACVLHIPFRRRYRYFCSQFVADILKHSRALRLSKDSALYLPDDLKALPGASLCFEGSLGTLGNSLT